MGETLHISSEASEDSSDAKQDSSKAESDSTESTRHENDVLKSSSDVSRTLVKSKFLITRKEASESRNGSNDTKAKRIDAAGGEIHIHRAILIVPPFSVDKPVLVAVTEIDYTSQRQSDITQVGLSDFMQPGIHLLLQPHGVQFLRPVKLKLKNVNLTSNVTLLVFHKEIEPDRETEWHEITRECAPEIEDENFVLTIDHFSRIEIIKLLIPVGCVCFAAGFLVGKFLNKQHAACNFFVYHELNNRFLTIFAEVQDSNNDEPRHQVLVHSNYTLVGEGSSKYSIMDEENLLFYCDSNFKAYFPLKLKECKENGQRIRVSIQDVGVLPRCLSICRRIAGYVPDQNICEIPLQICPSLSKESTWEKVLQDHRVLIMKHLDVLDILPQLRQDNIINVRQQEELLAFPAKETQAGKLLDIISTKDFTAFKSFIEAMKDNYPFITNVLEEFQKPPPSSSPGLDDHKTVKSMSSTNDNSVVANMPQKESGKSNCASYQPIKRPCVDVEKIKQPMRRVEEPQKPFEKCTSASGHFINGTDSGSKKTIQAKRLSEDEDAEKMPTLKKD